MGAGSSWVCSYLRRSELQVTFTVGGIQSISPASCTEESGRPVKRVTAWGAFAENLLYGFGDLRHCYR